MNNIEKNAIRIAKLLREDIVSNGDMSQYYNQMLIMDYSSYDYLMPIVWESKQFDSQYTISISQKYVELISDEGYCKLSILCYNTKKNHETEFIEAIQKACIEYLELKG